MSDQYPSKKRKISPAHWSNYQKEAFNALSKVIDGDAWHAVCYEIPQFLDEDFKSWVEFYEFLEELKPPKPHLGGTFLLSRVYTASPGGSDKVCISTHVEGVYPTEYEAQKAMYFAIKEFDIEGYFKEWDDEDCREWGCESWPECRGVHPGFRFTKNCITFGEEEIVWAGHVEFKIQDLQKGTVELLDF